MVFVGIDRQRLPNRWAEGKRAVDLILARQALVTEAQSVLAELAVHLHSDLVHRDGGRHIRAGKVLRNTRSVRSGIALLESQRQRTKHAARYDVRREGITNE